MYAYCVYQYHTTSITFIACTILSQLSLVFCIHFTSSTRSLKKSKTVTNLYISYNESTIIGYIETIALLFNNSYIININS